jgi:hypothetical protein
MAAAAPCLRYVLPGFDILSASGIYRKHGSSNEQDSD